MMNHHSFDLNIVSTRQRARGFTLIELMITVAIIAILVRIALPAYTDYVTRGRIPDATNNLSANQVKMEQWFQDNRSYLNGTACGVGASDTTSSNYFNFTCTGTASTYTLTATGKGAMLNFAYTVDQAGNKKSEITAPGWTGNTTCWVTKKGGIC